MSQASEAMWRTLETSVRRIGTAIRSILRYWMTMLTVTAVLAGSAGYWWMLSKTGWAASLFVTLSLASFMTGCLAGFLFTSYDEEAATVGKVRDWLIGALTGLTLVKFRSVEGLLLTFASAAGPQPFAMVVGVAVTFATLGYFAMFFQRELILNVLLAEKRAQRGQVEGTVKAAILTSQLLAELPPSLLAGIDNTIAEDAAVSEKPEVKRLRDELESDNAAKFLDQCSKAAASGGLGWDDASKAAVICYYLVYFADASDKSERLGKATEWIKRVLVMNPGHTGFIAKLADVQAMSGDYRQAVMTLERLQQDNESPAYVDQWLGNFLIHVPDRQDDAIRHSKRFLACYPGENATYYNIARAYAQKAAAAVRAKADGHSVHELKKHAMENLHTALKAELPEELAASKEWVKMQPDFECLRDSEEFKRMVHGAKVG